MSELKPCPFCGGPAFPSSPASVRCDDCLSATGKPFWNRRTPGPATRAMLEWVKRELATHNEPDYPYFQEFVAEWSNSVQEPCTEDTEKPRFTR